MTREEVYGHIDHTQLQPVATWSMIQQLCDEAIKYKTASVCIPPCFVGRIHDTYGDQLNICTVIGFPLGYNTTAVKVFETQEAVRAGAGEIDMVINLTDAKMHNYNAVTKEIKAVHAACGGKPLKVIIETCYLTEEEKTAICGCVTAAGAEYIKTSTGFGTGGATIADIRLFKANIGPGIKMKAAGGMKTAEDLFAFLEEGCERLGTSSGISLLERMG